MSPRLMQARDRNSGQVLRLQDYRVLWKIIVARQIIQIDEDCEAAAARGFGLILPFMEIAL